MLELSAPLAVAVAVGLGVRRGGRLGLAGTVVLCAVGVAATVAIDTNANLQRPDWRPVSRALGRPTSPRVLLTVRYGSRYPLRLYGHRLVRMSKRAVEAAQIDVLWVTSAPKVQACWWGAACELSVTKLQKLPSIPGFRTTGEVKIGRFKLLRLNAPTAIPVTPRMILRFLPPKTPYGLFFEAPVPG